MDPKTRMDIAKRQLAAGIVPEKRILSQTPQPITRRLGVITAVNWTTGEAEVLLNDETLSGLRWRRSYTPRVNAEVWVEFSGGQDPVIVDSLGTGLPGVLSWNTIGDTGQPAFTNAWVHYDVTNAWAKAAFKRDGDVLSLRGLIMDGAYAVAAFQLPMGYRPRENRFFPTVTFSGAGLPVVGSFYIDSSGFVLPFSGASQAAAGSWFSIECCTII